MILFLLIVLFVESISFLQVFMTLDYLVCLFIKIYIIYRTSIAVMNFHVIFVFIRMVKRHERLHSDTKSIMYQFIEWKEENKPAFSLLRTICICFSF